MNSSSLKNISVIIFLVLLGVRISAQESIDLNKNNKIDVYEDNSKSIDERIQDALERMTLEEKVKMLTRNNSNWVYSGCERLGIPTFTCHDGPHGVRDNNRATAFPTTAARGAAFDRDLSYRMGVAEGKEFRALGWNMRLGNSLDVNRHPYYGRASESAGEDPYLCAEIGLANVLGTQSTGCIANLKHFVLNTRENKAIRKNNQATVDERSLIEFYAYPFKEAIQRGNAWSVMTAHSRVNGLHCTDNPYVLDTILRDYFGYRYFVLNDWSSVRDIITQNEGTIADIFNAGHDLETNTAHYKEGLLEEIKAGNVSVERLNEAVGRVLRVILLSGLMDGQDKADPNDRSSKESTNIALEGARKAMVLLKNTNQILPFKKSGSVAIIGPNAAILPYDSKSSSRVRPLYTIPPLQAISEIAPKVSLRYAKGCDINTNDKSGFKDALAAAKNADYVVFVGGLDMYQEGEGRDRQSGSVQLPKVQQELIRELSKVNKKIVLVVISSGICALKNSIDNVDGILYQFYAGQEGGRAIAETLFGDYNPGGKLPVSMPVDDAQLPPFTDDHHNHIVKVGYRWYDHKKIKPQYAFGYGLSYTSFRYSNLQLNSYKTTADKEITVSVEVTNIGAIAGDEVVQLYVQDEEASVLMPVKQLKGFERITIEPGETTNVQFSLNAQDLSFWDEKDKQFLVEAGTFKILVGGASDQLPLEAILAIKENYGVPIPEPMEEVILPSKVAKMKEIKKNKESLLRIQAENFDESATTMKLIPAKDTGEGKSVVVKNGDWIRFKNINLGTWLNFVEIRYASIISLSHLELRLDAPDGMLFGKFTFDRTGSLQVYQTANIGTSDYGISGIHDVYIVFKARPGREEETVCHFNWWEIEGQK